MKQTLWKHLLVAGLASTVAFSAQAGLSPVQHDTAVGAVLGGVAGAAIGNDVTSTAIGAALGAVISSQWNQGGYQSAPRHQPQHAPQQVMPRHDQHQRGAQGGKMQQPHKANHQQQRGGRH